MMMIIIIIIIIMLPGGAPSGSGWRAMAKPVRQRLMQAPMRHVLRVALLV